eukprot:5824506-Prymnesium_polylepis.2
MRGPRPPHESQDCRSFGAFCAAPEASWFRVPPPPSTSWPWEASTGAAAAPDDASGGHSEGGKSTTSSNAPGGTSSPSSSTGAVPSAHDSLAAPSAPLGAPLALVPAASCPSDCSANRTFLAPPFLPPPPVLERRRWRF